MPLDACTRGIVNRRTFLQRAVAGAVLGAAPSGMWPAPARRLDARSNLTPDEELLALLAGNQRFVANRLTSVEHDLQILEERTGEKREPFAWVLACAGSRVPVELVFDQSIGHIFVTRL